MTDRKTEKEDSLEKLRKRLPPGSTVHCILRSVSRSGMSRRISFIVIKNGDYLYLDHDIGIVLGLSRPAKGDGLRVDGCGMDMGFHVVHNLSYALHGHPGDSPACEACHGTGNGPLVDDFRCHGTGQRGDEGNLFPCGYCHDGKVAAKCEACAGHGRLFEGKPIHCGYTLTSRWI